MHSVCSSLAYGVHLGESEIRQEVPGFSVSVLQPTFHAEDVPLHTHDTASLVLVMDGAYLTSADGPTKLSSDPLLVFNPAGTTHRDSFVVPKGRFLAVSVCDEVTRIANNGGDLPTIAKAFLDRERIATAKRLVRECLIGRDHDPLILEDLCWELIAVTSGTRVWGVKVGMGVPLWLCQARDLLNDRLTGALPITSIAQELGIHPVYFARGFRKHYGCSPSEYRMRCRLQRAMTSLCKSNHSLSSIALDAGFSDQSHFTTAFKQHFGHAPGLYRKNL